MTSYAGAKRRANSASIAEAVKDNKRIYKLIAIALMVVFVLVGLQAYTATLQHANNVLQSDNEYLQAEIDSLDAQIVEETKVSAIERTATRVYGMVYPTSDNCVTIHEGEDMADNLAATIRDEAYN